MLHVIYVCLIIHKIYICFSCCFKCLHILSFWYIFKPFSDYTKKAVCGNVDNCDSISFGGLSGNSKMSYAIPQLELPSHWNPGNGGRCAGEVPSCTPSHWRPHINVSNRCWGLRNTKRLSFVNVWSEKRCYLFDHRAHLSPNINCKLYKTVYQLNMWIV